MTPEDIAAAFAGIEKQIAKSHRIMNDLGKTLEEYAQKKDLSPYKTAGVRHSFGRATKSLTDALMHTVNMHDEVATLDPNPRPRTGGGK